MSKAALASALSSGGALLIVAALARRRHTPAPPAADFSEAPQESTLPPPAPIQRAPASVAASPESLPSAVDEDLQREAAMYAKIRNLIREEYVDEVEPRKILYNALHQALTELGPLPD